MRIFVNAFARFAHQCVVPTRQRTLQSRHLMSPREPTTTINQLIHIREPIQLRHDSTRRVLRLLHRLVHTRTERPTMHAVPQIVRPHQFHENLLRMLMKKRVTITQPIPHVLTICTLQPLTVTHMLHQLRKSKIVIGRRQLHQLRETLSKHRGKTFFTLARIYHTIGIHVHREPTQLQTPHIMGSARHTIQHLTHTSTTHHRNLITIIGHALLLLTKHGQTPFILTHQISVGKLDEVFQKDLR